MARSVIVASAMLLIIIIASWVSFYYTEATVTEFTAHLEKAGSDPDALGKIAEQWEERKQPLMLIINHRDMESISVALIRAHREAESGRLDMALQESDVAKFLMEELVERERLSLENIL